jgi:hypothetical protein
VGRNAGTREMIRPLIAFTTTKGSSVSGPFIFVATNSLGPPSPRSEDQLLSSGRSRKNGNYDGRRRLASGAQGLGVPSLL